MEKLYSAIKEHFLIIYLLILACALAAYLALTFGQNIWSDEAYTFAMLRHSFGEMCAITAADVHPPLYYIFVKLVTMPFNYSMLSVRIAALIPFIFIPAFGGIQLKRLFGEKTAALFMVLFLLFPFMMTFASEARMYSLAAAFVFVCAVYAYRCYTEKGIKNWIVFALAAAAAAYTHYFALVSVGMIYALLFAAIIIKKRALVKYFLLASAVAIALYAPWIKAFTEQLIYKVNNDYWIERITPIKLVMYWYNVFGAGGMKIFVLFSTLSFLTALIYVLKGKKTTALCLCILAVPVGTVIIGVAVSVIVRPVFLIRYIAPSAPLLALFMALALAEIKSDALAASMLTVAVIGGASGYASQLKTTFSARDNRIDYSFADKYSGCDSFIACVKAENISYIFSYYVPDKNVYRDIPEISAANPFENQKTLDAFSPNGNDTVLLLTDEGNAPPDFILDVYSCEYDGQINENGQNIDIYRLTR